MLSKLVHDKKNYLVLMIEGYILLFWKRKYLKTISCYRESYQREVKKKKYQLFVKDSLNYFDHGKFMNPYC